MPVTAFAEPIKGGNQWFGPTDPNVTMFFAGIETRGWRSVRKVKDGETDGDLFAFLTRLREVSGLSPLSKADLSHTGLKRQK